MIPVQAMESNNRLFLKFKYNKRLMAEVKAMEGRSYHGFDGATYRDLCKTAFGTDKVWSIPDTVRNAFQMHRLMGLDPYKRWDAPPTDTPLPDTRHHRLRGECTVYPHQKELVRMALARRYYFWAAEMRSGKTLAMILLMEHVGGEAWYVGPKSALLSVKQELYNWDAKCNPRLITYSKLPNIMENWPEGVPAPKIVFFDESHFLKTPSSNRSRAARALADGVREDHGNEPYWVPKENEPIVVAMTGSPAPKGPDDFWNQCEIVAPGFLREGHVHAFRERLGLFAQEESVAGYKYPRRITWWDDERKCSVCGAVPGEHDGNHPHKPSKNEVAGLYRRMNPMTKVLFTRDCIDIAPRIHRTIPLEPLPSTLRAARMIVKSSERSAKAQILLRELADGFQYSEKDGKRIALSTHSPKEDALQDILQSHVEDGRVVVYAGFQGSVDKCQKVAQMAGWCTIIWDGRGQKFYDEKNQAIPLDVLKAFDDLAWPRIAFIAQADSAGTGLNLSVADEIVYYSNSFKSDSRIQSEARCDAPNKRGVMITDLVHLPTDQLVLDNLKEKRDTQSIALGDLERVLNE